MFLCLQASEEGVHFIVSRQICLPTPDILQEAPWGMDGPPPYSPVDIEQTLLVSSTYRHIYTRHTTSGDTQRGALFLYDKYSLSGANGPWRYYSAIKTEHVVEAVQWEVFSHRIFATTLKDFFFPPPPVPKRF